MADVEIPPANAGLCPKQVSRRLAAWTLTAVCSFINAMFAVWAVLSTGRIRLRLFLVFVVASSLGFLGSIGEGSSAAEWLFWWLPSLILTWLMRIMIVVMSLLVVRACGYRLLPRGESG